MSEILVSKSSDVPSSVLAKIVDFVRPNAEYLKSGKPNVFPLSDALGKVAWYGISVRGTIPDAYFDAKGEFLYSVPGVLGFDGGPQKSKLSRDAMSLAGYAGEITKNGKTFWSKESKPLSGGVVQTEAVDPFSVEGLALVRDLSFQQDRLDIARRIYAKKAWLAVRVPPFSSDDLSVFAKAGSITSKDLLELRKLSLVDARSFDAAKAEIAKALPAQILDKRFSASVDKRAPDGSVVEIRPGWHDVGPGDLDVLLKEGMISPAVHKAAKESLDLIGRRSEELLRAMKGTKTALQTLKSETAHA